MPLFFDLSLLLLLPLTLIRSYHLHMLLHHQDGDANQMYLGAHAFSRDGLSWTWSPTSAYTKQVQWDDGTSRLMCRRERPALLLGPRASLLLAVAVGSSA